jgi:hypothetical protein
MIELYSFLAMFLVQILVISVLYPFRLNRVIQSGLQRIPEDRLADHYPGVDVIGAHGRFLTRYRTANAVVALLGLLLLGWFFGHMQRPDWDQGRVGGMLTAYFFLQNFPVVLFAWFTFRFTKIHRRSSGTRRKAMLERRALLDFVSPLSLGLAVLSYASFAAFMFYVARHPFPGFAGPLANIGIITLGYVLVGFGMYWQLYGRKTDPLQTHAERMRTMGVMLNVFVWVCIFVPVIVALSIARQMLDLQAWGPFASSAVFLLLGLCSFRTLAALPGRPRQPGADEPGSSTVPR